MSFTKFDIHDILVKPIFSTKAISSEKSSVFTFEVALAADKYQIKNAVEKIFGVKVLDVKTLIQKGEVKMYKRKKYKTSTFKKALVKVSGSLDFRSVL